jgi:hypothetical protein
MRCPPFSPRVIYDLKILPSVDIASSSHPSNKMFNHFLSFFCILTRFLFGLFYVRLRWSFSLLVNNRAIKWGRNTSDKIIVQFAHRHRCIELKIKWGVGGWGEIRFLQKSEGMGGPWFLNKISLFLVWLHFYKQFFWKFTVGSGDMGPPPHREFSKNTSLGSLI